MINGIIRLLSESDMKLIHDGALEILESVGMKIFHSESCDILKKAGCLVDEENCHVRFPKKIVDEAVIHMKELYSKWAREGKKNFWTGDDESSFVAHRGVWTNFKASTGPSSIHTIGLDNVRRPSIINDVKDSIRLADGLENIDRIGPIVQAQDVPSVLQPLSMVSELVRIVAPEKFGLVEV